MNLVSLGARDSVGLSTDVTSISKPVVHLHES
jgi:hypothetical protein